MVKIAKRYYWLKLKDDFFTQKTIKKLRRLENGDALTIIYLKLQLLAIKNDGKIFFENIEEDFIDEMSLAIDEDEKNIKRTLEFLEKNKMVEKISNEEFLFIETISCIGSETASNLRVKKYREKNRALQCNAQALQSNKNVTQVKRLCNTFVTQMKRRDRDKRKEIEKDIEIEIDNNNNINIYNNNLSLEEEIKLLLSDRKIKINQILKITTDIQLIKKVIAYADKNHYGNGFIIKALREQWDCGLESQAQPTNNKKPEIQERDYSVSIQDALKRGVKK